MSRGSSYRMMAGHALATVKVAQSFRPHSLIEEESMSPRSRDDSRPLAMGRDRKVSRRTYLQFSAAALAVLALPALPVRAAGKGALVRYVNVAAGSPALDVYIDGERVADELAFGKATKPARQPGG